MAFLDLSYNKLNGKDLQGTHHDVPDFDNCPCMKMIDLSKNRLGGKLPSVAKCSELETFSLWGNQFEGDFPDFSTCSNLRKIDLHLNQLNAKLLLETFKGCAHLSGIDLGENSILMPPGYETAEATLKYFQKFKNVVSRAGQHHKWIASRASPGWPIRIRR